MFYALHHVLYSIRNFNEERLAVLLEPNDELPQVVPGDGTASCSTNGRCIVIAWDYCLSSLPLREG